MVNFRTFDLNLLRILDALLETNSTVAAARRLHMSQPAVSAALGRLRHALGDPLFVRQGRALTPTSFARDIHGPLRDLLNQAETLLSGPRGFDPAQAERVFRISGSDFFAELMMPQLAEHLSRVAPLVRVQLVNLTPDEDYIQSLERFDIDMALIPSISPPPWIEQDAVFRSQFCVIARENHPRLRHAGLAPGDTIPLDLYCDLNHVLFSPDGKLSAMGDTALAQMGRERRVAMSLPVFSGVYNAVAASDMVALIPRSLARHMTRRVALDLYVPPMPLPLVQMAMVWHRRLSHAQDHRWLREELRRILAPLDDPTAQA